MKALARSKPVALVLGGTLPHVKLIRNLQSRGYYTILIDYFENPPAKAAADEHLRESTLDGEKVLAIANARKAALVISACIDQANLTACYVAEKLRLPAPYSYEVAMNVTNKLRMKRLLIENDIPTSKFYQVNDISRVDTNELRFPVIVKPADSNSSKGVRRADNQEQLIEYIQLALEVSRVGEVLVEEFVEGIEVGIDAYVFKGKAKIVCSRERCKIPMEFSPLQQIYGSVWPSDVVLRESDQIVSIAESISRVFGLENTPLMIQAIVKSDGQVNVIEFAPRVGGGENHNIIDRATSVDMVDATIDSFLGSVPVLRISRASKYWFDNYLYSFPGIMGGVIGHEPLIKSGAIEYCNIYKSPGVEVGHGFSSNNRIGVIALSSVARGGLYEKIMSAVAEIDIVDSNGQSIMRRDIYGEKNLAEAACFV